MTTRAKFNCFSTTTDDNGNQIVKLHTVYGNSDKDNEENNQFADATPFGSLEMQIDNDNAKGFFETGKEYYLDFTKAPE